ncbi:hypothetical protein [Nocardia amamiensis]|nr:hypothetical protein [Nocardia amamiensis]
MDIDAILASLPTDELEEDPWGGANLAVLDMSDLNDVPLVRNRPG